MADSPRVLVVIEDDDVLDHLQTQLESLGCEVTCATTPLEGLEHAQTRTFAIALAHFAMAGVDGLALIGALHAADANLRVIVLCGMVAPETELACKKVGAFGFLHQPYELSEIRTVIAAALT